MDKTPKALRLHIGLFGRMNVGKSSLLNMVLGQEMSITSPVPGTTTDVVEKAMELLPLGPVVFLDTAGVNDTSALSEARIKKTNKIFDRADFILLIVEQDVWTEFEEQIYFEAEKRGIPLLVIINKIDLGVPTNEFINKLKKKSSAVISVSSIDRLRRNEYVSEIKKHLIELCPKAFLQTPLLMGDLLAPGKIAVLIVPIDLQAPKGRLILPQVMAIRDVLDNDSAILVVKEREYASVVNELKNPPDIVVCDSQVVLKMIADTPRDIKCTTFSILFARYKGDLVEMVKGVKAIKSLRSHDKILISEACSHHAIEDDIGRVKIPRWLRQYAGADLDIDVSCGRDYPDDLKKYKVIIHCGSCMLTRRETIARIKKAQLAGVPITNYGVCIAYTQGVLKRVLEPFPLALDEYEHKNK